MKKTKLSILLVLAIVVLSTITLSGKVLAVNSTTIGATSLAKQFTITKEITDVTNPVTASFTYHIEEAAGNPATVSNLPADVTIAFNGATPTNGVVSNTTTLDLSNAKFTKLGDYKFIVTEATTSDRTTYPLDTKQYYVYVSVRNELSGTTPTGNLIATLVSQAKVNDTGDKEDMQYDASAQQTYIQLSKAVTGNIADSDAYFKFALNIPGTAGDVYVINGAHSTDGSTTVTTSNYTVGTTQYIYLKHGQTVTIGQTTVGTDTVNQIPIGTKYTITEQDATDYETYIDGSSTNSKATGNKTTVATDAATFNTADVTSFVNNKETPVLTGIFVNIAPFATLIVLAVAGLYIMKKTSKKEN